MSVMVSISCFATVSMHETLSHSRARPSHVGTRVSPRSIAHCSSTRDIVAIRCRTTLTLLPVGLHGRGATSTIGAHSGTTVNSRRTPTDTFACHARKILCTPRTQVEQPRHYTACRRVIHAHPCHDDCGCDCYSSSVSFSHSSAPPPCTQRNTLDQPPPPRPRHLVPLFLSTSTVRCRVLICTIRSRRSCGHTAVTRMSIWVCIAPHDS
jgi:hypothetical protein